MVDAHQTTTELESAIAAAREDASSAGQRLGEWANEVFGAVSARVVDEVERRIDEIVVGQPRRTEKLDDKRLAHLRADVEDLLRTLPGATMKQLAGGFQWTFPHEPAWIGDADQGPMYHGASEPPTLVTDVIRRAIGGAGRIAAEAGYELQPRSHWATGAAGQIERYVGPIEPSRRLTTALRGYADARVRYFRRLRAVRRLESERAALERRVDAEVEREDALRSTRARWASTAT